ncbi:MAG: hypothetical protein AB7E76_13995 [Deferribacterales bacterium]
MAAEQIAQTASQTPLWMFFFSTLGGTIAGGFITISGNLFIEKRKTKIDENKALKETLINFKKILVNKTRDALRHEANCPCCNVIDRIDETINEFMYISHVIYKFECSKTVHNYVSLLIQYAKVLDKSPEDSSKINELKLSIQSDLNEVTYAIDKDIFKIK